MAEAIMRIQVDGLADVPDGRSRVDGVPGALVTVTSVGSGTNHSLQVWDTYPVKALNDLGDILTIVEVAPGQWTFTINDPGVSVGLWLIVDDGDAASAVTSRRKYSTPTTNLGLIMPLFGETADPDAGLINFAGKVEADLIEASLDNAEGNMRGWSPRVQDVFYWLEALYGVIFSATGIRNPVRATEGTIADLSNVDITNIDGLTLVKDDRVLVRTSAHPSGGVPSSAYAGIYVVGTVAAGFAPLTRATDANNESQFIRGMIIGVAEGTAFGGSLFELVSDQPVTLDSDPIVFQELSSLFYETRIAALELGQHTKAASVVRTGLTITGTDTALAALPHTPVDENHVEVYYDGLIQNNGVGNDWTLAGDVITWLADTGTAPDLVPADKLRIVYWY